MANEKIGEVECQAKGCDVLCPVYKYAAKGQGRQLFAGKLYAQCSKHGRFGWTGQPSSQGSLDYILENAKIWGESQPADHGGVPASTPPPSSPKPSPAPRPPKDPDSEPARSPDKSGWGGFTGW